MRRTARTVAVMEGAAGNPSTARSCLRRPWVASAPVTGSASKPQGEAAMAARERVAFLGLGIMGYPMAPNLRLVGFDVVAWNRQGSRDDDLAEPQARPPREGPGHV